MKRIFQLSALLFLLAGCARIPVQSVELADALQTEGERMHRLNLALLNNMFNAKKKDVEKFVSEKYAPEMLDDFKQKLPAGTDFKTDFQEMVQAIMPKINARKDSLLNTLETQREKLTDKLNTDYKVFENAASALKKLLESAVKIDQEKAALFGKVKELSKNTLDLGSVENAIDTFIHSAGSAASKINTLHNTLDLILNK